jgi:hypothetical protein
MPERKNFVLQQAPGFLLATECSRDSTSPVGSDTSGEFLAKPCSLRPALTGRSPFLGLAVLGNPHVLNFFPAAKIFIAKERANKVLSFL